MGKIRRDVVVFLGDLLKNRDDLSDCEPETRTDESAVPDVTVVLVSPSSVVTVRFEDVSLDSKWEFAERQSLSFSKKRSSSPVKKHPNTRRRMMPSTPQQISHSSTDESQWQEELEAQSFWSILERRAMAAMENYLRLRRWSC